MKFLSTGYLFLMLIQQFFFPYNYHICQEQTEMLPNFFFSLSFNTDISSHLELTVQILSLSLFSLSSFSYFLSQLFVFVSLRKSFQSFSTLLTLSPSVVFLPLFFSVTLSFLGSFPFRMLTYVGSNSLNSNSSNC